MFRFPCFVFVFPERRTKHLQILHQFWISCIPIESTWNARKSALVANRQSTLKSFEDFARNQETVSTKLCSIDVINKDYLLSSSAILKRSEKRSRNACSMCFYFHEGDLAKFSYRCSSKTVHWNCSLNSVFKLQKLKEFFSETEESWTIVKDDRCNRSQFVKTLFTSIKFSLALPKHPIPLCDQLVTIT